VRPPGPDCAKCRARDREGSEKGTSLDAEKGRRQDNGERESRVDRLGFGQTDIFTLCFGVIAAAVFVATAWSATETAT
jgi:hypothetical protein